MVRKYSFLYTLKLKVSVRQDEMYNESVSVFNCASLSGVPENNCDDFVVLPGTDILLMPAKDRY